MAMSSLTFFLFFSVKFIYSNSSHLEWRAGLSDTILKWDYSRTIPAKFGLIWFSGFREDLNVIFYQNMPNLHNRYKSYGIDIQIVRPEMTKFKIFKEKFLFCGNYILKYW
jgi:hypothetical protein